MMRKTTDRNRKKIAPVVVAVLVVVYLAPILLFVLSALAGAAGMEARLALPILVGYLVLGGAVIGGVVKAMMERLREIDGGEEDEASKY